MNSKNRQGCLLTLIKGGYDRGYSLCQSGVSAGKWYLLKDGTGITICDSRFTTALNARLMSDAFSFIFSQPAILDKG